MTRLLVSLLCLCGGVLVGGAGPSVAPPVQAVWQIELNTFGGDQPRTAIIYRAENTEIIDWRWYSEALEPFKVRDGLYVATWRENGKLLHVTCQNVKWTRTKHDVELAERASLQDHKRRRLR